MILSKDERDAIQSRLQALAPVASSTDAAQNALLAKEWLAALLAHAETADAELLRLSTTLEIEKERRERAERGLDFFTSGDWVI